MDAERLQEKVKGKAIGWSGNVIGIDPGANTGFAIYDPTRKKLLVCKSAIPIEVEEMVLDACSNEMYGPLRAVVEDTRGMKIPKLLQKNFGQMDQGVGQVHAEMRRWEQFFRHHEIPFVMRRLSKAIPRKIPHDKFLTEFPDFKGRTNHNSRDAALLAKYG